MKKEQYKKNQSEYHTQSQIKKRQLEKPADFSNNTDE